MPLPTSYTQLAVAAWLCAAGIAAAQLQPDDAGDTFATAGILQVGVNQGRFDYKLPRAMDIDLWSFTTEPGKVYSVRCVALDSLTESLHAMPVGYASESELGFSNAPNWTRGSGGVITRTVRGIARADGTPVRYMIEIVEAPDPGDPESLDPTHPNMLQPGEWSDGTVTIPAASTSPPNSAGYAPTVSDFDAFQFAFDDRGIYRIEVDGPLTSLHGYLSWRGILTQTSSYGATTGTNLTGPISEPVEFRGSGTAGFSLGLHNNDQFAIPYRVRVVRLGTAPPDDHGDTPAAATPLIPGTPPTRVALSTAVASPGSTHWISEEDWFSVQTVAGHSYEVRVERAGVWPGSISSVIAEDGTRRADAALNNHQVYPATNLLSSIRFRGRNGPPVRFGLIGVGTVALTVIDQGPVTDDLGDPLTGPAVLSLDSPTITGRIENPRDVDSFVIEPPTQPGQYQITLALGAHNTAESGFALGYSLISGASFGRTSAFHINGGAIPVTRRTNGSADSFPLRLDMLCKPYPTADYPLIGPTITYTLTFSYVGPLPVTPPPNLTDDAPATAAGAAVLQPGQFVTYTRQGTADLTDAALLNLQPGRLYRIDDDSTSGDLFLLSGSEVMTDALGAVYSSSVEHFFTVSNAGLYLQLQRFDRAAPGTYSFPYSLGAGVMDYGPAIDDQPSDVSPRRLTEGTITGTFDYPGDHDRFFLPYEPAAFYVVTATSTVPISMQREESDNPGMPYYTTVETVVGFPASELPPAGQLIILTSRSEGASYHLNVRKLYHPHPSDDLPDTPGVRPPLNPGETATVALDHVADRDVVEYRVQAGHSYRFSLAYLHAPETALQYQYGNVYDAQGRTIATNFITTPIRADIDEIWHLDYYRPYIIPLAVTLIDEGIADDDAGTGERNRGHTEIGQTVVGTLERSDDIDIWSIDSASTAVGSRTRVTITNLDSGLQQTYKSTYPSTSSVFFWASSFATQSTFPLRYQFRVDPLPPGPSTDLPCRPDLGISGGATAQSGYPGDRSLDNNDLIAFINLFFANSSRADFGSPGGVPQPDGWLDNNDFIAFIDLFFAGCP